MTEVFEHSMAFDKEGKPIDAGLVEMGTKTERELVSQAVPKEKQRIFNMIKSVEQITYKLLEKNPILRYLKFRKELRRIVEKIYGKELSDETVARSCREIQNERGLFKVEDKTEIESIYKEYYSK